MNIKFISYTGEWPSLCTGILTLKINNKIYIFNDYKNNENTYPKFWYSSGDCGFFCNYEGSYINPGPWEINVDNLPKELQKYAEEIKQVLNDNIEHGCCGGCL